MVPERQWRQAYIGTSKAFVMAGAPRVAYPAPAMLRVKSAFTTTRHGVTQHALRCVGATCMLFAACGLSQREVASQSEVAGAGGAAETAGAPAAGGAENHGGMTSAGGAGNAGGDENAGGATAAAAPDYVACIDFLHTLCNKLFFECNGAPNEEHPCPPSVEATCPDRYTSYGATTTTRALASCAAEWEAASCEDVRVGIEPDCLPRGFLGSGDPCVFGAQCQSGYCLTSTRPDGSSGCGTCARVGLAGDDCTGGDVHCADGLECHGTCTPSAPFGLPPGSPCDRLRQCADGYVCIMLVDDAEPHCQTAPAPGEACPLDTPYCAGNCNADGICEAAPGLGEACALSANASRICDSGLRCDLGAAKGPTCARPLKLGKACNPVNEDFTSGGCEDGALCHCDSVSCMSGTCVRRRDAFASCTGSHDVCAPGTECADGVCAPSVSQDLYVATCYGEDF